MINSLLMLGSTYRKNRKANYVLALLWIGYMLLKSDFKSGLILTIMNAFVFAIVFLIGQVVKKKYANLAVSITSILLWSVLIDIACYYIYPNLVFGRSLLAYIESGILFNFKYVVINCIVIAGINVIEQIAKKVYNVNLESVVSSNE